MLFANFIQKKCSTTLGTALFNPKIHLVKHEKVFNQLKHIVFVVLQR